MPGLRPQTQSGDAHENRPLDQKPGAPASPTARIVRGRTADRRRCPDEVSSCATTCFKRKCKGSHRFDTQAKCEAKGHAWCGRDDDNVFFTSCAEYVADCVDDENDGVCYEARCSSYDTYGECTEQPDHFWCGARPQPTFSPTVAPSSDLTCVDPDAFVDLEALGTTCGLAARKSGKLRRRRVVAGPRGRGADRPRGSRRGPGSRRHRRDASRLSRGASRRRRGRDADRRPTRTRPVPRRRPVDAVRQRHGRHLRLHADDGVGPRRPRRLQALRGQLRLVRHAVLGRADILSVGPGFFTMSFKRTVSAVERLKRTVSAVNATKIVEGGLRLFESVAPAGGRCTTSG